MYLPIRYKGYYQSFQVVLLACNTLWLHESSEGKGCLALIHGEIQGFQYWATYAY